jgi:hypothetical protein
MAIKVVRVLCVLFGIVSVCNVNPIPSQRVCKKLNTRWANKDPFRRALSILQIDLFLRE